MLSSSVIKTIQSRRFTTSGNISVDTDWVARSTAAGVEVANRLQDSITLTDWLVNDSTADHVTIDTSVKDPLAIASFKFDIRNTDTTASGSVCIPFSPKGEGSIIWTSYRVRADDAAAYQQYVNNAESGSKVSILSRDANGGAPTSSNQSNEIVVAINYSGNLWSIYHQDGAASGIAPDIGAVTACSGSDFIWQPEIDNGANPLTGNNPATGAAWSACHQDRARYGGLYSAKSNTEYQPGLGDPVSGGVKQKGNVWYTVTVRAEINDLDDTSFTNRLTQWIAEDGQPYKKISDQFIKLGSGPSYNGLTLLPYVTSRSGGGRKSVLSGISGVSILGTGGGTALGAGSLEYVASTGAFRFKALNDSYGTARYISAANNIYTMNLKSSLHGTATTTNGAVTLPQASITLVDASAFPAGGGSFVLGVPDTSNPGASSGVGEQYLTYTGKSGNTLTGCSGGTGTHSSGVDVKITSYISVRVDNPALLPGSGTTTATVTVSDGRNAGQFNYQDVIISSQPINARGGFPPLGVSVIDDAAAGMTSGQWLQLTGGNLPSGLGNYVGGPASGIKTHYAINMAYLNGKAYWIGSDHGAFTDFIEYDFTTNAINLLPTVPWTNNVPPNHGYNHIATVGSTLWACGYNQRSVSRWNGGSSWTTIDYSGLTDFSSAAKGVAFHPNMGPNGTVLVFQLDNPPTGVLIGIDPVTLATRTIVTAASAILSPVGLYHNFAVYNPVSDVVLFGGGNGANTCWTIDASETVTAKANIPSGLSEMGPATDKSRIYADPVSGNFIGIRNTTDWQTFNPTANTWTAHSGTVSMLLANVANSANRIDGTIGVDLRHIGVSLFIKAYSSSADAEAWLWKP